MMPRRRVRALLLLFCLSALDFSGCFVRRRIITRKGGNATPVLLTADKQTLMDRLAHAYQAIQSFSATVDMVPALGSSEKSKITEYKDVRGYILFRKPTDIRIIGLYPLVRNKAFDMVSNGTDFRLYLPAKNRFVIGSNQLIARSQNRIENLRPQHFLAVLLVAPRPPDGQIVPTRSVWFNRINLHIARQLVFDPAGNILTDARYSDWQNYDGLPFPKTIDITRPQDEYAVVLTVVKMDINRGVADDKFVLEQPEGTQLQVLGQPAPTPPPAPPPVPKGKKKKP